MNRFGIDVFSFECSYTRTETHCSIKENDVYYDRIVLWEMQMVLRDGDGDRDEKTFPFPVRYHPYIYLLFVIKF